MVEIVTRKNWVDEIKSISGVRSVSLEDDPGKVRVLVEYTFWTRILWWRKRKALEEVMARVYASKPYGVSASFGV